MKLRLQDKLPGDDPGAVGFPGQSGPESVAGPGPLSGSLSASPGSPLGSPNLTTSKGWDFP